MEMLEASLLGKPAWMWILFIGTVVVLLVLDLGVLHRKVREIGVGDADAGELTEARIDAVDNLVFAEMLQKLEAGAHPLHPGSIQLHLFPFI